MTKLKVVPLTKNYVAVIDLADWPRVRRYKWHATIARGKKNNGQNRQAQPYARASVKGRKVYLHVFLMQAELEARKLLIPEKIWHVDHKNHQTLDCRRSQNLEVVTHLENYQRRRSTKHSFTVIGPGYDGVPLIPTPPRLDIEHIVKE